MQLILNVGFIGNIFVSMVNNNLLVTLAARRRQNAQSQLKSVLLEMYEIFGPELVHSVISECEDIYNEYLTISKDE